MLDHVAWSLGHEPFSTALESDAKPKAIVGARQRQVLTFLEGAE